MDLWDLLRSSAGSMKGPGAGDLEAPPTLHPVPLDLVHDAAPGETVTARTLHGSYRDFVLTEHVVPELAFPGIPDDVRGVEGRGVCSRALWQHHADHPEEFARYAQVWPLTWLWVWRESTAPTAPEDVPRTFDWMGRALAAEDRPAPRVPMRAQDAGSLAGREVVVRRYVDGDGPAGSLHSRIAVGEVLESADGFEVPCQTVEDYYASELDGWRRHDYMLFPVQRVWVRV